MIKVRTISLQNDALHWLIAKAQNLHVTINLLDDTVPSKSSPSLRIRNGATGAATTRIRILCSSDRLSKTSFEPNFSNDANQAQHIIENVRIGSYWNENLNCWAANIKEVLAYGSTQLKACMVCYAVFRYGAIAEVPQELLSGNEILVTPPPSSSIRTLQDINNWVNEN